VASVEELGTASEQAPFREAEIRPRCAFCAELGTTACPRCGRPLCARHQVGGRVFIAGEHGAAAESERRCATCEEEYSGMVADAERRARRARRVGYVLFLVASMASIALAVVARGWWVELLFAILLVSVFPFSSYWRRFRVIRRSRRRFLEERAAAPRT
jgi:uncharacterized membrane protein